MYEKLAKKIEAVYQSYKLAKLEGKTLKQLSEETGIKYRTLKEWSRKYKWTDRLKREVKKTLPTLELMGYQNEPLNELSNEPLNEIDSEEFNKKIQMRIVRIEDFIYSTIEEVIKNKKIRIETARDFYLFLQSLNLLGERKRGGGGQEFIEIIIRKAFEEEDASQNEPEEEIQIKALKKQ